MPRRIESAPTDLPDGTQFTFSDGTSPADNFPAYSSLASLTVDLQRDQLLLTADDPEILYAIDIDTGTRSIVSNDEVPNDINPLLAPGSTVVDAANDRALISDRFQDAIIAVDLNSGERTIFAEGSAPDYLAIDRNNNRLLASDLTTTIAGFDLESGIREVISDSNAPHERNPARIPSHLVVDPNNDLAYLIDFQLSALLAIDLVTGERVIVLR